MRRDNDAVTEEIAFFTRTGEDLMPTPLACSMWSEDQLHGVAVSGALARAAELALREAGRADLRPARWVVPQVLRRPRRDEDE